MADPNPQPVTIDSAFRSGSITAIGVVVGFSLSFFSRWAALPGEWSRTDLTAVSMITVGIGLQIVALASMLSIESLKLQRYKRAVRFFIAGLALVGVGIVFAVFSSILGFGSNVL